MYESRLFIAKQLTVAVRCNVDACEVGVDALLRLFERDPYNTPATLTFSIASTDDEIGLHCNEAPLWQGKEPGEIVAAFEWAFYNQVIDALYPDFVSLHAASVRWLGHGICIAGASGAGKSSLSTAALLDGADYFSDEYSLLGADGRITPFPRPLQWDGETHPAFSGREMRDSGLFDEGHYAFTGHDGKPVASLLWLPRHTAREPVDMSLLILPRFDAECGAGTSEALPRSQALMELAAEMHHKLPVAERLRELHRRIPETTQIRRLTFSDARAAWHDIKGLLTGD